eukprot:1160894-Pelagomonas_calceolata.AAC.15
MPEGCRTSRSIAKNKYSLQTSCSKDISAAKAAGITTDEKYTHNNSMMCTPAYMEDAIDGGDVGQEGVAQTLSRGSSLHQASNIHDLQVRRHLALQHTHTQTHSTSTHANDQRCMYTCTQHSAAHPPEVRINDGMATV